MVQAIISMPLSTACCIRLSKLSIRFFFMMRRIIRLPAPPIFIFDSLSFPLWAGSIQPNILPKRSFETVGFRCFLMMSSPQKVKNIVTFRPVDAAPLAMTKEANALSRSLLKTISVLLSAALPGRLQASCFSCLRIVAATTPFLFSSDTSSAPVILHQEATSLPKAWSVAVIRSCSPAPSVA